MDQGTELKQLRLKYLSNRDASKVSRLTSTPKVEKWKSFNSSKFNKRMNYRPQSAAPKVKTTRPSQNRVYTPPKKQQDVPPELHRTPDINSPAKLAPEFYSEKKDLEEKLSEKVWTPVLSIRKQERLQ